MIERLVDDVAALCAEGIYATAGQVYAWSTNEAADVVIGGEGPATYGKGSDVLEVFCLTKPMVAVAAVIAAEAHDIDVCAPLRRELDFGSAMESGVSLEAIINHSTSLQWPSALEFMLQPLDRRPSVGDLRQRSGGGHCYSEIAGWLILTELIETLTGQSCASYVHDRVASPLGIADEIVLDGASLPRLVADDRLVAPLAGLPVAPIPLLHIFAPAYWLRIHPALGGLASARAVGVFTSSLIACLAGASVDGMPGPETVGRLYAAGGTARDDATWRRRCAFALAHEVSEEWNRDGAPHRILQLSSHFSMATVAVDPVENEGFAMMLNGSSSGGQDLAHCRDAGLTALGFTRRA